MINIEELKETGMTEDKENHISLYYYDDINTINADIGAYFESFTENLFTNLLGKERYEHFKEEIWKDLESILLKILPKPKNLELIVEVRDHLTITWTLPDVIKITDFDKNVNEIEKLYQKALKISKEYNLNAFLEPNTLFSKIPQDKLISLLEKIRGKELKLLLPVKIRKVAGTYRLNIPVDAFRIVFGDLNEITVSLRVEDDKIIIQKFKL
jgi:hypothetical protein